MGGRGWLVVLSGARSNKNFATTITTTTITTTTITTMPRQGGYIEGKTTFTVKLATVSFYKSEHFFFSPLAWVQIPGRGGVGGLPVLLLQE